MPFAHSHEQQPPQVLGHVHLEFHPADGQRGSASGALLKGSSDEPWTPFPLGLWQAAQKEPERKRGARTKQLAPRPRLGHRIPQPQVRWGQKMERGVTPEVPDCAIPGPHPSPLPCQTRQRTRCAPTVSPGRGLSTCGSPALSTDSIKCGSGP